MPSQRCWMMAVAFFTVTLALGPLASAQHPALRNKLSVERLRHLPARLSWIHWWEVDAHHYLEDRPPKHALQDEADPANTRGAAVERLLVLTSHADSRVRLASALALGRIGAPDATDRLVELVGDDEEQVRVAATVALGLLDNAEARAALEQPGTADGVMTIAWLGAIGMQRGGDDNMRRALLQLIDNDRSSEVAAKAAWALRIHGNEDLLPLVRRGLRQTEDPIVANELIQFLGEFGTREDRELLLHIAMIRPAGARLPVMRRTRAAGTPDAAGIVDLNLHRQWSVLRSSAAIALRQAADLEPEERAAIAEGLRQIVAEVDRDLLERDEAVVAARNYLDEGRGLLEAEEPPARFRWRDYSVETVLSRRAAVQGLGLIGGERAAELLTREWGKDPWVSLEVAAAARRMGHLALADDLVELMNATDEPALLWAAAWSAGELLDRDDGERLRRLLRGYNYHAPLDHSRATNRLEQRSVNPPIPDVYRLAQPFFFDYLLPDHTPR